MQTYMQPSLGHRLSQDFSLALPPTCISSASSQTSLKLADAHSTQYMAQVVIEHHSFQSPSWWPKPSTCSQGSACLRTLLNVSEVLHAVLHAGLESSQSGCGPANQMLQQGVQGSEGAPYEEAEEGLLGLLEQKLAQGLGIVADHGQQHVHGAQLQRVAALLHHDRQHLRPTHLGR